MREDSAKAPSSASTVLTAAIISGAVIIAAIGTFLPDLIGMEGTPALVIQVVFYAVAAIDVAIAFWLKAKLTKQLPPEERKTGSTVQRQ